MRVQPRLFSPPPCPPSWEPHLFRSLSYTVEPTLLFPPPFPEGYAHNTVQPCLSYLSRYLFTFLRGSPADRIAVFFLTSGLESWLSPPFE